MTIRSDGGGVVHAARKPVIGREAVALFTHRLATRLSPPGTTYQLEWISAEAGIVTFHDGRLHNAVSLAITGDVIADIFIVVNPGKLFGPRGPRGETRPFPGAINHSHLDVPYAMGDQGQ